MRHRLTSWGGRWLGRWWRPCSPRWHWSALSVCSKTRRWSHSKGWLGRGTTRGGKGQGECRMTCNCSTTMTGGRLRRLLLHQDVPGISWWLCTRRGWGHFHLQLHLLPLAKPSGQRKRKQQKQRRQKQRRQPSVFPASGIDIAWSLNARTGCVRLVAALSSISGHLSAAAAAVVAAGGLCRLMTMSWRRRSWRSLLR